MTYIIILITVALSMICFNNRNILNQLACNPYMIAHKRQWYRMITHGFVHGDWNHLLVNMFVLWSFGTSIEQTFKKLQYADVVDNGLVMYLLLYFGALVISSLYDILKYKNRLNYSSIGASGAVSAIVFASVFFNPMGKIYFFGVIPIPGIIFAIIYILYEQYLAKKSRDNINHYAHLMGAAYGFIFPLLISPNLIDIFIQGFK